MSCVCEGKHGYDWHKARGLPLCQHVKAQRKAKDQNRSRPSRAGKNRVTWTPGTYIRVPEYDPL